MTSPTSRLTRRAAVQIAASAALTGLTVKGERRLEGGFVFESQERGHAIRDHRFVTPAREIRKTPILIVGGGVAGLSAAWWLRRNAVTDFVLLEMEPEAGGNGRWGENEITAYPWAAHYVPVPNQESVYVRELFTELGLLVDGQWDERWLCHSPQERLWLHGRWQEGIEPELGLSPDDRRQFKAFADRIREFRETKQFTIPSAVGAPRGSELDKLSFRQWLDANGFKSQYLQWLADYSTRDDYGASSAETSAWAGIHYFAAREHEERGPLTWPEGNGWIVRRLLAKLAPYVRTNQPAVRIERSKTGWRVYTPGAVYEAGHVIYAAPTFLLPYLNPEEWKPVPELSYSPWLVANLTLDRMPAERGLEPAWDNVIYNSPSLGYVVATHQGLASRVDRTVLTYYWALAGKAPAEARRELLATDWTTWTDRILADLARPHPDIRQCVRRIDIFRIGHAMARPTPGFLTARRDQSRPRFHCANSDVSGLSLFEEAQYRGIRAAEAVRRG